MARAFDAFRDPDSPFSQRQYANEHGLPRSTLGDWLRQEAPSDLEAEVVAFFRSQAGQRFLRVLLLALFKVYRLDCPCGLRPQADFLRLCRLDAFVACSYGALYDLDRSLHALLREFAAQEHARLCSLMEQRDLTLCGDENFHQGPPCLVAIDPVSGFVVGCQYRDHRSAADWTAFLKETLGDFKGSVLLLGSDQAKGLLACASEISALHSPDLFHRQRELFEPVLPVLIRPIRKENKELEKLKDEELKRQTAFEQDCKAQRPKQSLDTHLEGMLDVQKRLVQGGERLLQAKEHLEQVADQVRGLGLDYHPFDRQTGAPVEAAEAQKRLSKRLDALEAKAKAAGAEEQGKAAADKGRGWSGTLVAVVAWFWSLVDQRIEALDLSQEAETVVRSKLVSSCYWQTQSKREASAEERARLRELARQLGEEAWREDGPLAGLSAEEKEAVQKAAQEAAGMFRRSSSCVEGLNGRLSLHRHGQGPLSQDKLNALVANHNYLKKAKDGSTAAERFTGVKQRDAFVWLLQRMPDLPRPAAKRPNQGRKGPDKPL
jgi:hypothetical protein